MRIMYPDYDNCIVNLSCSVMKYFGVNPPNATLPVADELLSERRRNVVVMLIDGMGKNILEQNLAADGFFRRNLAAVYSSVFPPTTTAATTSINCGLYPVQTAYLGWTGYFKELDKNVVYFRNTDFDTDEPVSGINAAQTYLPYKDVCSLIRETGAGAHFVAPFREPFPDDFGGICREVERLCAEDGGKYIYAYYHEPDAVMHRKGCFREISKLVLGDIELMAEELSERLSDTLLIITADHGHIDSPKRVVTDYPDIMECLERMPSIEPRCLNLFVKEGMEKRLEAAFAERFPDSFLLMSKKEVMERELFGRGTPHPRLDEMLGDYLAIAVGDISIYNKKSKNFVANHAGLTEDEMLIPLIAVKK